MSPANWTDVISARGCPLAERPRPLRGRWRTKLSLHTRDDGAVGDRLQLRRAFDSVAELYDRARPRYPVELFDVLIATTGVRSGDHVLEVGCATGIATRPLADRGLNVTCLELGEDLARVAQRKLAGYPHIEIVCADFESWVPTQAFDLVAAATAWHWIDPETRYQLAWQALRPGGHLAFWTASHVIAENGDPFFTELQDIYDEIGEGLSPDTRWPRPGQLPDSLQEITDSGLFSGAVAVQFDWELAYSAEEYIDLLNTFSGHITMSGAQRDTLYGAIRHRIARRPSDRVNRHWGAVLHMAQKDD